jgi:hypothetical protein
MPLVLFWVATTAALAVEPRTLAPAVQPDRVVNGVPTSEYPSTVALLTPGTGIQFCTGTLVGCRTVVTAAHCVCESTGAECQAGGSRLRPANEITVFAQHGGFVGVEAVHVPPDYEFGVRGDVAVLELRSPLDGITPTPVNEERSPSFGTPGTIVGFGLSRGDRDDAGLKRQGRVTTSTCTSVPEEGHVCWRFAEPLGEPGTNSNTCPGDCGGPLLAEFGSGPVLAGITSGGTSEDCLPADQAWDTDVFAVHEWIRAQAGADLDERLCGELPPALTGEAPVFGAEGALGAETPEHSFTLEVPLGAELLRVALNGEEGPFNRPNDFDLYLRADFPASTSTFDCASQQNGNYELCDVAAPQGGPWHFLVDRFDGSGRFQLTATVFGGAEPAGACVPDATTLCVDDVPGDHRFRVTVGFETALNGGQAGAGQAIPLAPLGVRRGGLFWFFDVTNPELLIKVLNGCNVSGHYWVFWSAGTTVGLEVTVTDTLTGRTVRYFNTDGQTAAPVADVEAFVCDGG